MTGGFTKLFNSIIHSSVWQEPPEVCKLWVTMLAMADQHGVVNAAVPGLASAAILSRAATEEGLRRFESPDPDSRTYTPECEGRRIRKIDGGWLIINHKKYRELLSAEQRRESVRKAQQTWRDKHKSQPVIKRNPKSSPSSQAEEEVEADKSLPQIAEDPKRSSTGVEGECDKDCQKCSGEFCASHATAPCDCDVIERHSPRTGSFRTRPKVEVRERTSSPDDELLRQHLDKMDREAECKNHKATTSSAKAAVSGPASLNTHSSHSIPDTEDCGNQDQMARCDMAIDSDGTGPTSTTSTMFPTSQTESEAVTGETSTPHPVHTGNEESMTSAMFPGMKDTKPSDKQAEAIYWAYPRHIEKTAALKAIKKAMSEFGYENLLFATHEFAASPAGKKGVFTPYPASWFNAGGYQTDPKEWQLTAPVQQGGFKPPAPDSRSASIAKLGHTALDNPSPKDARPYELRKAIEWKCSVRSYFLGGLKDADGACLKAFQAKYPEIDVDAKR